MKKNNDCTSIDVFLGNKDSVNVIVDPVDEGDNSAHIIAFMHHKRLDIDIKTVYVADNKSNKGSKGYKRPYKFHK